MSDFAVIVSSVAATAGAAESVHCDLSTELARLRVIADEVCGGWCGSAAAAFESAWSAWVSGALDVVAGLERLAEALHESARAYSAQDAGAAAGLRLAS